MRLGPDTEGAEIFYTTDGSKPEPLAGVGLGVRTIAYRCPFTLPLGTHVLKAVACLRFSPLCSHSAASAQARLSRKDGRMSNLITRTYHVKGLQEPNGTTSVPQRAKKPPTPNFKVGQVKGLARIWFRRGEAPISPTFLVVSSPGNWDIYFRGGRSPRPRNQIPCSSQRLCKWAEARELVQREGLGCSCPECGEPRVGKGKFCSDCGAVFPDAAAAVAANHNHKGRTKDGRVPTPSHISTGPKGTTDTATQAPTN